MIEDRTEIDARMHRASQAVLKPSRSIPLGGFDPAARELGPIRLDPNAPDPRPAWPADARFSFGDAVQCTEGAPYRFPGLIVGWHRRHDGGLGYAVSREGDPGNVEIFGERRLEARS